MLIFNVFFEAFVVFLQIGAEPSLVARTCPRSAGPRFHGRFAVTVMVARVLTTKTLLVLGGLLSINHHISA